MCPELLLPRGSKIRTLLIGFPEILRLSTHHGYSSVLVTYLCGRTKVRNASSVTTDGNQAPTGNYVILTKRGKKRPDFTPFCQIYHFRVKYACYLHHLFHFDEICLQVIMLFTSFCQISLSFFAPSLEYLDIILCLWHEFFSQHWISENRRKHGLPKEKLIRVLPTGRTYKIK